MAPLKNNRCNARLTPQQVARFAGAEPAYRLEALAGQCQQRVTDLRPVRKLGAGTFGTVLLCTGRLDGREVRVAVKETRAGAAGEQTYKEVDAEVRLAARMAEIGSGPRIFDMYYVTVLMQRASRSSRSKAAVYQYLVMEAFDGSLASLFSEKGQYGAPKEKLVQAAVPAALAVLRRHLEAGVECYDIKPGNFVFRVTTGRGVEVRMIDFGVPHCELDRERDCSRAGACARLDPRGRDVFVILAAQLLALTRLDLGGEQAPLALVAMRAAEEEPAWRARAGIVDAVLAEFQRNESARYNYEWYRFHGKNVGTARLLSQFRADLALPETEKPRARTRVRPEAERLRADRRVKTPRETRVAGSRTRRVQKRAALRAMGFEL